VHPLLRACALAASLGALSAAAPGPAAPRRANVVRRARPVTADALSAVCPAGSLPDVDQCVPFPADPDGDQGAELVGSTNVHRERDGHVRSYENIPRLPERPADYDAYRYPVPPPPDGHFHVSGYDLDRPDAEQRRGRRLTHVGHGGVDLMHARGTEVRSVALEHQQGDAEVVLAGKLFGISVVTRHTVREGGRTRDYVVLHGHLDSIAPGLGVGATVRDGDLLGAVGDTGSEGMVHLHLEVRQVRDGVEPDALRSTSVVRPSVSIPCDPRNVMPVRTAP
jgi:murein DD-endopeptidase MepM/ murein hydrolase activator NlpD